MRRRTKGLLIAALALILGHLAIRYPDSWLFIIKKTVGDYVGPE